MSGFAPVATFPVAAVDEPTGISAPVPFYLSDLGWTGEPDDPDAPNRHYAPRVQSPLRLDRSIPITPDAARRVLLQLGDTTIVNGDGALDELVRRMAIDGHEVAIKAIGRRARYASAETIFQGTASSWKLAGDGSVALALRDASWQLDAPAQQNFYGGTGTADGGADLKNKPKPLLYGECLNAKLVLIDSATWTFQAHDGAIEGFLAVYDAGLALIAGNDVSDIFAAATPPAGTYITQRSAGLVRLAAKPFGIVTADVRGDKAFGTYVSKAGGIAFRIAHDRGGVPDARFDLLSFELLNNLQPAPVGLYTGTSQVRLSDMIDVVLGAVGAWWGSNRFDMIEVGRLDLPGDTPVARLGTADIIGFDLLDTPAQINPPLWKVRVGHQRNWTPDIGAIAAAVDGDRLTFLANEYRYGVHEDAALTVAHLRAQEMTAPGLFANEADADAEAARLQALYAGPLQLARIRTKLQGYLIPMNRTINVTYPRYGLAGGKNVITVGQGIDASRNESTVDILIGA
jgi:hypothetical protein